MNKKLILKINFDELLHPFQARRKLAQHFGCLDWQAIEYNSGLDWSREEFYQSEDDISGWKPSLSARQQNLKFNCMTISQVNPGVANLRDALIDSQGGEL